MQVNREPCTCSLCQCVYGSQHMPVNPPSNNTTKHFQLHIWVPSSIVPSITWLMLSMLPTFECQPTVPISYIHVTWLSLTVAECCNCDNQLGVQDDALPIAWRLYLEPLLPISFSHINIKCIAYKAFHWLDECLKQSSVSNPLFSCCCHNGKVTLPALPAPPNGLHQLFTSESSNTKQFRRCICQYNSALAFTSFTTNNKNMININNGSGSPWVWKCGYMIYHHAGGLFPEAGNDPMYMQPYFYDPQEALDYRMCNKNNIGVNYNTMKYLQNILNKINQYKPLFFHAYKILQNTLSMNISIHIIANMSTDLH